MLRRGVVDSHGREGWALLENPLILVVGPPPKPNALWCSEVLFPSMDAPPVQWWSAAQPGLIASRQSLQDVQIPPLPTRPSGPLCAARPGLGEAVRASILQSRAPSLRGGSTRAAWEGRAPWAPHRTHGAPSGPSRHPSRRPPRSMWLWPEGGHVGPFLKAPPRLTGPCVCNLRPVGSPVARASGAGRA